MYYWPEDKSAPKLPNGFYAPDTLKHRRESEPPNFRIICDDVRNLLAKKYLADTELSAEDIAHWLGYTEMTNFRRAFIRWSKITPVNFRETK